MSNIKHILDFTNKKNIATADQQESLGLERKMESFLLHPMDFGFNCIFLHQLDSDHYKGLEYGSNEIVEVPLRSGRTGIYKVDSHATNGTDTGQRNYHFIFLKIKGKL